VEREGVYLKILITYSLRSLFLIYKALGYLLGGPFYLKTLKKGRM
jgi:hypothetical protein